MGYIKIGGAELIDNIGALNTLGEFKAKTKGVFKTEEEQLKFYLKTGGNKEEVEQHIVFDTERELNTKGVKHIEDPFIPEPPKQVDEEAMNKSSKTKRRKKT